jgi:hypothetical protein
MVRHYGHLAIILKRDKKKRNASNRTPLKMRPTGLGSDAYKDNLVYSVFRGEWLIGRIYERYGFPDAVRFFWSPHGVVLRRPPSVHTDGFAPTLDDAKAQFQKRWDAWKAWAKLEEAP